MPIYSELRATLQAELRSCMNSDATDKMVNEVVRTLLSLGDYQIDAAMLKTIGRDLLNDADALIKADAAVIDRVVGEMRTVRAMKIDNLRPRPPAPKI